MNRSWQLTIHAGDVQGACIFKMTLVNLASHVVRHPAARGVLVASYSAANQRASTPLQLCRNVLASSLAARQQGRESS